MIGVPDAGKGEVGKAVVVTNDPALTAEDLRHFMRGKIASIKQPVYYALAEEIPKSSLGKVKIDWMKRVYGQPEDGRTPDSAE